MSIYIGYTFITSGLYSNSKFLDDIKKNHFFFFGGTEIEHIAVCIERGSDDGLEVDEIPKRIEEVKGGLDALCLRHSLDIKGKRIKIFSLDEGL